MRRIGFGLLIAIAGLGNIGCHTCGDRPRLIDRIFHRDESPSSRFSQGRDSTDRRPCDDAVATNRASSNPLLGAPTKPVSYGNPYPSYGVSGILPSNPPLFSYPGNDGFVPNGTYTPPSPARSDELPQPGSYQRISPPGVPEASPMPAVPNVGLMVPNQFGRMTTDPKKP